MLLKKTMERKENNNNFGLSKQQIECLHHLVKGMTAKQTAKRMGLSYRTVEFYIENIKAKLSCTSRVDLIEKAFQIAAIQRKLFAEWK